MINKSSVYLRIFDMGVRLFLALRNILSIPNISSQIIEQYVSTINQTIGDWHERAQQYGASFPPDNSNYFKEVRNKLQESLERSLLSERCIEVTRNFFLSGANVNELVDVIVRNDVIQWVIDFIDSATLRFPDICVTQNIRRKSSAIELECDYRNNCVDIKIPQSRKFTME